MDDQGTPLRPQNSFVSMSSRKTNHSEKSITDDASRLAHANSAATAAAKSMLVAGSGNEIALSTAQAAAQSVLRARSGGNNFLSRRKAKRQAKVIASMALMTATTSLGRPLEDPPSFATSEFAGSPRSNRSVSYRSAKTVERRDDVESTSRNSLAGPSYLSGLQDYVELSQQTKRNAQRVTLSELARGRESRDDCEQENVEYECSYEPQDQEKLQPSSKGKTRRGFGRYFRRRYEAAKMKAVKDRETESEFHELAMSTSGRRFSKTPSNLPPPRLCPQDLAATVTNQDPIYEAPEAPAPFSSDGSDCSDVSTFTDGDSESGSEDEYSAESDAYTKSTRASATPKRKARATRVFVNPCLATFTTAFQCGNSPQASHIEPEGFQTESIQLRTASAAYELPNRTEAARSADSGSEEDPLVEIPTESCSSIDSESVIRELNREDGGHRMMISPTVERDDDMVQSVEGIVMRAISGSPRADRVSASRFEREPSSYSGYLLSNTSSTAPLSPTSFKTDDTRRSKNRLPKWIRRKAQDEATNISVLV